jgi:hypothetical protein
MTNRPSPPIDADTPDELSSHVAENAEAWLLYFRNLNAYLSQVEEDHRNQAALLNRTQELVAQQQETNTRQQGVIAYQEEQIGKLQNQLVRAHVDKERAIDAAQPAVLPARPAPAVPMAEPLVDLTERETPAFATPPSESSRPSEKLPDPDAFKGQRSDLRRFIQQICSKITSNADRFPTAQSRLIYVAGRLKDNAYNLILPKTQYSVPQFIDYPQLLEYLEQAFSNPNRVQNAQDRLYILKQKNQDFSVYLSEFQRLALEGEMPDSALTPLLYQGISRELQDMLLHNPAPTREFQPFARHLQELDNRYRRHQQQVSQKGDRGKGNKNTKPVTPSQGYKPGPWAPTKPAHTTDPDSMDLSTTRQSNKKFMPGGQKERSECYRCRSKDHFVGQCPHPPPAQHAAQLREGRTPHHNYHKDARSRRSNRTRSPSQASSNNSAKGVALI